MKIILYYQTFTDISSVLIEDSPVTHIHVSSLHFGENEKGDPYIHLNNFSPYNSKFDDLWENMKKAVKLGIRVKLMLGGAGGAYTALFSNYPVYYSYLKELLVNKSFISGIDLDIEEEVNIKNVKKLILDLKNDFKNSFTISMTPVQYSLQSDVPGLGGFSYKDLVLSNVGKYINYLNGQFYDDYSKKAYDAVVDNGYNPEWIVMGMEGSDNLDNRLKEIHDIYLEYKDDFGGVYLWEYCLAHPDWAEKIKNQFKTSFFERLCTIL